MQQLTTTLIETNSKGKVTSKQVKVSVNNITYAELAITPEMAKKMLENCHPLQRKLNKTRVANYLYEMKAGKWHEPPFTFDVIAFDPQDRLVNGLHRLNALAQFDRPLRFNVLYGIQTPSEMKLPEGDNGMTRDGSFVTGMSRDDYATCRLIGTFLVHTPPRSLTIDIYHTLEEGLRLFPLPHRPNMTNPLRAAFIMYWKYVARPQDSVNIQMQWGALARLDYTAMQPSLQQLTRTLHQNSRKGIHGGELYERTLYALHFPSAQRIQSIKDGYAGFTRKYFPDLITE